MTIEEIKEWRKEGGCPHYKTNKTIDTMLAEVERLKHPLVSACASFENGKKQAARELINYLVNELEYHTNGITIIEIKRKFGLEG